MTLLVYRLGGSLGHRLGNQNSAHHHAAMAESTWRRVSSVRGRRFGIWEGFCFSLGVGDFNFCMRESRDPRSPPVIFAWVTINRTV